VRLLDQVRQAVRLRHFSLRTEDAYADWVRRFVLFHEKRHPRELGPREVEAFLTYLAAERRVSASTQNQAKAALLFLDRDVLGQELPWLDGVVQAKGVRRLPVVLTQGEVRRVLDQMDGSMGMVAALLYGTGMRLLEGLRLRVKDLDFERLEVVVRQGKGGKDRVTMLPAALVAPLQAHLEEVRRLHRRDLEEGHGRVMLPEALALKMPQAARAWGWQWVFPSHVRSTDPRSGEVRRHHLYPRACSGRCGWRPGRRSSRSL
jgi:integron integrase